MKHPLERRIWWGLRGFRPQPVLDLLQESQWWPRERLDAFRDRKLRALMAHCWEHVPYYRKVMDERGLRPQDFNGVADLPKLPILTKDSLRRNGEALRAQNIPAGKVSPAQTGGTTGEPVTVWRREQDAVWNTQCYARGLAWGGLEPAMPRVKLFGGSLGLGREGMASLLRSWLRPRTVFLAAFELTRQNAGDYLDTIRASEASHLIGYTSALYLLALYAEQIGQGCVLDAVYPTAELLLDEWREKMAAIFSCRVLPYYGCGEVNSLGYSCGEGEGYHRSDEHAVMEVEQEDGTIAFEGEGAFLVTDLDNYAMPILRYRNGDSSVLSDEPCPCGRSLGRIVRLKGRVNDYLLSSSGERIAGSIAPHTFRLVSGVDFYQFVQNAPGHIMVRIVPTERYDRDTEERKIRQVLLDHLGRDATIEFEYVDAIERSPAGKARFVINNCLAGGAGSSR